MNLETNTSKHFSITKNQSPNPPVVSGITLGTSVKSKIFGIEGVVDNILYSTLPHPLVTIKSVYIEDGQELEEETTVSVLDCEIISHKHEAHYLNLYRTLNDYDFNVKIGTKVKDISRDVEGFIVGVSINSLTTPLVSLHRNIKKTNTHDVTITASIHELTFIDEGVSEQFSLNNEKLTSNKISFNVGDEVALVATPTIKGEITEVCIRSNLASVVTFKTKADKNKSLMFTVSFSEVCLISTATTVSTQKKSGCIITDRHPNLISSLLTRCN